MNAINILKHDHRTVRGLLRRFQQAGEHAAAHKQRIAEQLFNELDVHTTIEQELFYPAVRDAGDHAMRDFVLHAVAEHDVVATLITELKGLTPATDEHNAKFMVLEENVTHHIEKEEGEMFSYAAQALDDPQLRELGRQMADRRQALSAPSLIGESLRRAKTFVAEAVAAVTGNGEEAPPRRRPTRSRKRAVVTPKAPPGKRGHSGHSRSIAARKSATN